MSGHRLSCGRLAGPAGCLLLVVGSWLTTPAKSQPPKPTFTPRVRTVDLRVGEERRVQLCDGSYAHVKLLKVSDVRDPVRHAVRASRVTVEVNGRRTDLVAAAYRRPFECGARSPWVIR